MKHKKNHRLIAGFIKGFLITAIADVIGMGIVYGFNAIELTMAVLITAVLGGLFSWAYDLIKFWVKGK